MAKRVLIINCDDFGQSRGINDAVVEAHTKGILTSASLMVRYDAALEAARIANTYAQTLSVGLHIELGEWTMEGVPWYEVVPDVLNGGDLVSIDREIGAQIEKHRQLVGCNPTHLDSHQHIHQRPHILPIVQRYASQLNVPLRGVDPVIHSWGGTWGVHSQQEAARAFRTAPKKPMIEMGCHPSREGTPHDQEVGYGNMRQVELAFLCSPEAKQLVRTMGITLRPMHRRFE